MIAVLVPVLVLVVLGLIVLTGGLLRSGSLEPLSSRLALRMYLRFASAVTTGVIAIGLASFLTAILTVPGGRGFSYSIASGQSSASGPTVAAAATANAEIEQRNRTLADAQFRDDLVRGASVSLIGLLMWLVHTIGLRIVETQQERQNSWLSRLHRLGLLGIFGVAGLVALPFGGYELFRYLVIDGDALSHSPPGSSVAIALALTPVWLYELWQTVLSVAKPAAPAPAQE